MKHGCWLILCLVLAGWQVAGAQETAAAPPCFNIPSDADISSNEGIASYREHYIPQQYPPESAAWIGVDIAMLAAILLLGCVMVWRQVHTRHFWLPAVLSLLYFGFLRGGCICPVGSVTNLAIGLSHPERVGLSTGVMFLLPLAVALCIGRVFCVAGCPLGVLQHLLGGRRPVKLPAMAHAVLRCLPPLALVATVWLALRGGNFLICLLDPYKTAFFFGYGWIQRALHWLQGGLVEPGLLRIGDLTAWGVFAAAVLLGRWVYRPFCRFVCPYGVLLGLLSMVAFKRRRIDQDPCVQCGICAKQCPVDAITRDPQTKEYTISAYHCIQCNGCSSACRKDGIH